jgi:serine/threonine protein kinase
MNSKYKILDKIGEGSFSNIYKAQNNKTNQYVAIKISHNKDYNKLLIREMKIYKYLKNISGIPQLLWCGIEDPYYYMVLPLYIGSLQNVKIDTTEKLYEIGNGILSIIDNIHKHNIIHRDIKPDNIMFNEFGKITIIDFGLCKIYKDTNNKHIPFKKINNIIGTINYVSINVHNLHEPCRSDDVESVIYVLLYIYNPQYMEWFNYQNVIDIKNKKENIIFNNKIPNELIDFLIYTRSLLFTDQPRYNIV